MPLRFDSETKVAGQSLSVISAFRRRDRAHQEDCDGGATERGGHLAAESVAERMHGSNETRVARVVAERSPDLGDEAGQVRLVDERIGPDRVGQLLFGERPRTGLDQNLEQAQCFR